MEHLENIVMQFFYLTIFLIGVMSLLRQKKTYENLLNQVINIPTEQILYEQQYDKEGDIVSYCEIIAQLFHPLEYDLNIDGIMIHKYEYSPDQLDKFHIVNTVYQKSYVYDALGNISCIVYTSSS